MARRRGKTVRVYVNTVNNLKYGFRTNEDIHNSYKSELGQVTYAGAAGVVFGANSPKPAKASKEFESGTIGSYCSNNKIDSLKKANWIVTTKGSIRGVKTNGKTQTVYIEMPGGWNYAWNITKTEAALAATLGFTVANGADASSLVWGVNYPKPPRATKRTNGSSTSTFMKPQASAIDKAIEAGFSVSGVDYELLPNP